MSEQMYDLPELNNNPDAPANVIKMAADVEIVAIVLRERNVLLERVSLIRGMWGLGDRVVEVVGEDGSIEAFIVN